MQSLSLLLILVLVAVVVVSFYLHRKQHRRAVFQSRRHK